MLTPTRENSNIELMKFRLSFSGRLPSSSKTPHHAEKMAIRRVLHPQLEQLWKISPVLQHVKPIVGHQIDDWEFVPLVTRDGSYL
jgi:hypothetical protein